MPRRPKKLTAAELQASRDQAGVISDRLEIALDYRGATADYRTRRVEVSYEVMEQLLDAYNTLLERGEWDE